MSPGLFEVAIGAALIVGMILSVEVGFRLGWRRRQGHSEVPQFATVQGAVLGLLALLLGFSFSGATSRFIERQDILVSEANAIGTAYLRADLLPPEHRDALRRELSEYIDDRIQLFEQSGTEHAPDTARRLHAHQTQMWAAAMRGIEAKPAVMLGVLPPLNDVFDLLSTRDALVGRHLPMLVLGLLIACAAVALGTIGYGSGLAGRRNTVAAGALALLIATALWVTIDLDYPKRGLVRIGSDPLLAAREAMRGTHP